MTSQPNSGLRLWASDFNSQFEGTSWAQDVGLLGVGLVSILLLPCIEIERHAGLSWAVEGFLPLGFSWGLGLGVGFGI